MRLKFVEEADVIVVGYGGAGAVTAIVAHDAGAKVLILEKQPSDTATRTRHTPSTRMAGGGWFAPRNADTAALYLRSMAKAANETLDPERESVIAEFARHLVTNTDWMSTIGIKTGGVETTAWASRFATLTEEERALIAAGKTSRGDYPGLAGSEDGFIARSAVDGAFRGGAALFKSLSEAVQSRRIPVLWECRVSHLVVRGGEVRGVVAEISSKPIAIKAKRAVVLTCGGFEFDASMKENYLRVNPVYFYGCPHSTGDGVNMAMEVGAALWHMNNASWWAVMKFPDFPVAIATRNHETGMFVDKFGQRFTSERFKLHAFGYELTAYDAHLLTYPKVPFYMVFDEKRRREGPLASLNGVCNPPGGVPGDIYYDWSADNQREIERGWIMKASTIEGLADKMRSDPDNGGFMSASVLQKTCKRYGELCHRGEDVDFHKDRRWLQPLEDPPYYAVKLWPGGPNTQGGPRRNARGQVLSVNNTPIPRLYSAGELGSVWGMLYQGGGSIAECVAFGRISGANAASEKRFG